MVLIEETVSMRCMRSVAFVVMMIVASGCAPASEPISEEERRTIEAEVRRQLDSLRAAWTNLDAPAVVRHYADHAIDTYDGERGTMVQLRGWAEIGYEDVSGTEVGPFRDLRFDVLSRDAVVVSWVNSFTETDAAGKALPERLALMTQVWIRREADWRILHNHESTRPAAHSR
jgi:ketosteroid isomerase-like protein